MEFFDKLGKKASEAYKVTADKTGKIAKEAKLKMKMNELKSEINDIYQDIGKSVYENHVKENKDDIYKQLKDKKKCPNCFTEIEKDVKFCPECGAKQETNIDDKSKEVEIVDEKSHNKENKQQDNNSANSKQDNNENNTNNKEKSNLEKTVEIESDVNLKNNETVEHIEVEDEEDDDD